MTRVKFSGCCAALALASLLVVGCDQQTTKTDVNNAREEVREEQVETQEVREQASEAIAEKEQALQETQDKEMDKVREQEQVAAEAVAKAGETENKYQSQEALTAYVDKEETQLKDADQRIDDLKVRAGDLTGDEKQALDTRIERLQELRTRAGEKLAELKSADQDEWTVKGNAFERAMKDLFAALNEAR